MTLVTAPPADDTRIRRAPKPKLPWGSPLVYFVALAVIALMLGPVIYIIIGGFRSNSAITVDPAGFPDPWNVDNYVGVVTSGQFWARSATRRSSPSRPRSGPSRSDWPRATSSPATRSRGAERSTPCSPRA